MKKLFCPFLFIMAMMLSSIDCRSQWKYQPTEENLKNSDWFQNAQFGLFIRWGIYRVLGDGER
jgi:alpha-L-fucosidase